MSFVACNEIWSERKASIDEKAVRRYTRVWRVVTDNTLDGPLIATSPFDIPRLYTPYITPTENDLGARVRTITPTQDQDNPLLWRVVVEYSSEPPERTGRDPQQRTENPLLRPPEISWSFEKYRRVVTRANIFNPVTGETQIDVAVLNTASEAFDPPLEADDSRLVLTYVRNEIDYLPTLAMEYQDAINEDVFLGALPGQAKVDDFSASSSFENNVFFYRVTYKFAFKREQWHAQVLDAGYKELIELGDEQFEMRKIKTKDGENVESPYPLDGRGRKGSPSRPVFLQIQTYKSKVFAPLGIIL